MPCWPPLHARPVGGREVAGRGLGRAPAEAAATTHQPSRPAGGQSGRQRGRVRQCEAAPAPGPAPATAMSPATAPPPRPLPRHAAGHYEAGPDCSCAMDSLAITKLELAVASMDSLVRGGVQYDSITVLPPVSPPPAPPPLPRTRSFKDPRARTVAPVRAGAGRSSLVGGRASSAPPISPFNCRRLLPWDR